MQRTPLSLSVASQRALYLLAGALILLSCVCTLVVQVDEVRWGPVQYDVGLRPADAPPPPPPAVYVEQVTTWDVGALTSIRASRSRRCGNGPLDRRLTISVALLARDVAPQTRLAALGASVIPLVGCWLLLMGCVWGDGRRLPWRLIAPSPVMLLPRAALVGSGLAMLAPGLASGGLFEGNLLGMASLIGGLALWLLATWSEAPLPRDLRSDVLA